MSGVGYFTWQHHVYASCCCSCGDAFVYVYIIVDGNVQIVHMRTWL